MLVVVLTVVRRAQTGMQRRGTRGRGARRRMRGWICGWYQMLLVFDQRARHAAACTAACDSAGVSGKTRWRMRWRWWGPGSRPLHCRCRCHDRALSIVSAPGGLFASRFASIVKCVGQQKPAPRTLVLAWMQARWSCILSIPGAHCSRTLGYLIWLVGRGCNSSGQGP